MDPSRESQNPPPYNPDYIQLLPVTQHHEYIPDPNTLNPPILQKQTSNAVVVGSEPQTVFIQHHVTVADNQNLTVVLMIICGILGNWLTFTCLIPALIFSKQSIEASDRGDIETARKQGRKALYLDLAAIFVPIGIGIITFILYFFVVLIAV